MLVAVVAARRLNRPLATIANAAQEMAAGRLDVQVPEARIKEFNDLALAFNRMSSALAEADRQRKQMTADIAHELRTPLSIIKARLEGVQDGIYHADSTQIERLLHETALLERLIEDLRLLALAEAGQLPLYTEPTAPRDLLENVAAAFAEQAAAQGVRLCVEAPADLPAVLVDPQRLTQVLANLVSNALRHTPEGGSVTLAGSATLQGVLLAVHDTGRGIAPDDLPHIFDRFWKADRARRRSGGTGLGLAIARQIVLAHRGEITARSTLGTGTTITITLPPLAMVEGAG
ncbi:MAG: HAMP domain-containing histidine kinase [Chloroflexaceae bacterium]|nr:HAMP domain-containing histidine kinase [Chloroflexaceae bacterium]